MIGSYLLCEVSIISQTEVFSPLHLTYFYYFYFIGSRFADDFVYEESETFTDRMNVSLSSYLSFFHSWFSSEQSVKKKKIKESLNNLFISWIAIQIHIRIHFFVPRSNRHGRKRSSTEKYDDLHGPVLRAYTDFVIDSVIIDLGTLFK